MDFKVLMSILNATIQELNKHNYNLYDPENPSYYVSGVKYDDELDTIYLDFKEDM